MSLFKTALVIDPEIWKAIKIQAALQERTLTEIATEALNNWIRDHGVKSS